MCQACIATEQARVDARVVDEAPEDFKSVTKVVDQKVDSDLSVDAEAETTEKVDKKLSAEVRKVTTTTWPKRHTTYKQPKSEE